MCFVWISEQTAIISLYNINWLVCITETECVYCAVRAESLIKQITTIETHEFFCNFWYFHKYCVWNFVLVLKIVNSLCWVPAYHMMNLPNHLLCQSIELLPVTKWLLGSYSCEEGNKEEGCWTSDNNISNAFCDSDKNFSLSVHNDSMMNFTNNNLYITLRN
jgi:hypothetical protein